MRGWDQSERDSVRSFIGDGHERLTDAYIDAVAAGMPYPTPRKVADRLLALLAFRQER